MNIFRKWRLHKYDDELIEEDAETEVSDVICPYCQSLVARLSVELVGFIQVRCWDCGKSTTYYPEEQPIIVRGITAD